MPRRQLETRPDFAAASPQPGVVDAATVCALAAAHPDRTLELLAEMAAAADQTLARLAERLAGRLVLDLARAGPASAAGVGRLAVARADLHGGDIDLDRSLESLLEARAEGRSPRLDELWVQRWQRPAMAVGLLIDRSGSMSGARLATAAVAAAACALRAPAQWATLAFGDQAVALKSLDRPRPAPVVVRDVLRLRGYGTTDLAGALDAARGQLARATARRKVVVLLSDCRATAGTDPVAAARRVGELCVLGPADDAVDAREFAATVGARFAPIAGVRSIPGALNSVLA